MRHGHQKCRNTQNSQGNEFWPETGKYFKAMGSQRCSSHSAILRWKIHLNLSKRWHKIIASWHTSTASGFPDFGFNSGETQSQMWGSASPRPPSCSRDLTAESSRWIQAPAPCIWGIETEPGALPLFWGRCSTRNCSEAVCAAKNLGRQLAISTHRAIDGPHMVRNLSPLWRWAYTPAWSLQLSREAWGGSLAWRSHQRRCSLSPWDLTALDQPATLGFGFAPLLLLSTYESLILLGD